MTEREFETLLELLNYPNPVGLHPVEARYRDFCRMLIAKGDEKIDKLEQRIHELEQEVTN